VSGWPGQGTSDPLLSQIGVKEVVAFYDREAAKVSAATLRRRLLALRKFFSWAESEGYARAILSLLYFTGIRVSELCTLNTNSIGERLLYGKPSLRVAKGKGGARSARSRWRVPPSARCATGRKSATWPTLSQAHSS
jgi:site-specific recombinase XerD